MRYVNARYEEKQRELAYRFYITDALYVQGGLNMRFYDLIHEQKEPDKRAQEQKVQRLRDKLND